MKLNGQKMLLTHTEIGTQDVTEMTQRLYELEGLLIDMPTLPVDHPIRKEIAFIRSRLDPQ